MSYAQLDIPPCLVCLLDIDDPHGECSVQCDNLCPDDGCYVHVACADRCDTRCHAGSGRHTLEVTVPELVRDGKDDGDKDEVWTACTTSTPCTVCHSPIDDTRLAAELDCDCDMSSYIHSQCAPRFGRIGADVPRHCPACNGMYAMYRPVLDK